MNWYIIFIKITIKYSEFTTVIWKLDGEKYSRFIIDNYSNNKDATAHNFISQDGNYTDILKTETPKILQSIKWVKSMRWGNHNDRWIRPIKNILCTFNNKVLKIKFANMINISLTVKGKLKF